MSGLRVLIPAAAVLLGASACAGGSASAAQVCSAYDDLGGSVRNVNGIYDNPVFSQADDLGDVAARYHGGTDLSADAEALHAIADDDQTSVAQLSAATDRIARLCGHDLMGIGTYGTAGDQNSAPYWGSQDTTDPGTADPGTQYPDPTTDSTDALDPPSAPDAAYQRLTGPRGISVEVPATWQDGASSDTYRQVGEADPAGALARFGGYAPTRTSLLAEITGGERGNPKISAGYQRISLSATTFRGAEAVDWEFTFTKDGVTRHVHGLYWRTGGTEYLVYASAPDVEWPALEPVFDVMRDSVSTP